MSHACCIDELFLDRMYIHGGTGVNVGNQNFDDLWSFEFKTRKFSKIYSAKSPSKPPPMYGHTLNYYNSALYLFGGTTGFNYFKDLFRFDLNSRTWESVICIATPGKTL